MLSMKRKIAGITQASPEAFLFKCESLEFYLELCPSAVLNLCLLATGTLGLYSTKIDIIRLIFLIDLNGVRFIKVQEINSGAFT